VAEAEAAAAGYMALQTKGRSGAGRWSLARVIEQQKTRAAAVGLKILARRLAMRAAEC